MKLTKAFEPEILKLVIVGAVLALNSSAPISDPPPLGRNSPSKSFVTAARVVALSIALVVTAAASPASARARHHQQTETAPYSHINSGWGPPRTWDEIEVSHPEGGG